MEQHDYIVLLEKFFKKEASSEERRILIEWIRKPGIRNEFNLLCEQMWKEAAVEIDKTVEEEMWNHLQRNLDEPKILSPKKRRWQLIIYKVAATILLPVCLGLATYFGVEHINKVSQDPFMMAVDYGQKANLTLPDGTKVWLNSATHLSYDAEYNKSDRKIYLDGEAYFQIAKDDRPFRVITANGIVKQYGTSFNVNTHVAGVTKVVLVEGAISVLPNQGDEHKIHPGELAVLNGATQDVQISKVDIEPYIAWNSGRFVFDNCSLETLMEVISRWYDKKIMFEDEDIKTIRFTGDLDRYGSIIPILKAIQRVTHLEMDVEGEAIIIRRE